MSKYIYRCNDCLSTFDSAQCEKELTYLCPRCGSTNRNEPLNGVLIVEYDYDKLKTQVTREMLLKCTPGQFLQYSELWPLNKNVDTYSSILGNLFTLNPHPVQKINYSGSEIIICDDTRNPTLSYKDRASILVGLKAMELGIREISAASTGNAGSSLAGVCARLGLKSKVFVPGSIPAAKLVQLQSYAGDVFLVNGSYDDAFDLCIEISQQKNWYNRNTAYNPLTIEGKKSAAYDIFISLDGKIPGYIFIPAGDGVITAGLFKGFSELQKLGFIEELPKLIAVQAEGSDAIYRYHETGKFEFQQASTIADSICAAAPRNLLMASEAVKQTNGNVIRVSDDEILSAQKISARELGFLIEPASAAALAGYLKFSRTNKIKLDEKVLLMFTGNGLKDSKSLMTWNEKPPAKTCDEWKDYLFNKSKA